MSERKIERVEMSESELRFILQEGEGLKIEFKESFDKTIAKEMVAFANASGGKIFLGIDDSGRVVGCALANKLKSRVLDIAKNCDPSIKTSIEFFKSKNYLKLAKAGEKPAKGLGEKLGEKLGENQKKILKIISRDRFVSIRKLSAKLNISTTAVENNISKLKQKSLLKRTGSAKGGHWEIVEK